MFLLKKSRVTIKRRVTVIFTNEINKKVTPLFLA
jgi:hypothetical protein